MTTLEAQFLKSITSTSASNTDFTTVNSISISKGGDVYVTGNFRGTISIGNGVPSVTSNTTSVGSAFLARYSGSLTPLSLTYMSNTEPANTSQGISVCVSKDGDVYVTGLFDGTLSIGDTVPSVTTDKFNSTYLARYSSSLTPLSLTYMKSTYGIFGNGSEGRSVFVSDRGYVYVTGGFSGTLSIGGTVPSVSTDKESGYYLSSTYLAKYSSSLTPLSLTSMKTNMGSIGWSISVSKGDYVYVIGNFNGTLSISDSIPSVSTNVSNRLGSTYLAMYNSSLTPLSLTYMKSTDPIDFSNGYSISISDIGDVYVTGSFGGTLSIGDTVPSVTTDTNSSTYLARYNSTLKPLSLTYMKSTESSDGSNGYSISVSDIGDVYVTGNFSGTLSIGDTVPTVTTDTNSSTYLAMYNSSLTPLSLTYMKSTESSDGSYGFSISVSKDGGVYVTGDFDGGVYVTGDFNGTLSVGDGVPNVSTNVSNEFESVFLAKYVIVSQTTTTTHYYPICLVAGTPILTDQGIVAIEKINTAIHTIGNKRIVAITKAITPEEHLITFEANSIGINCPTKKTIMTPGHEVLYMGKLVQAKNFVGKLNGVHKVLYDGKVVYNVLLEQHGLMSVNNMIVETLHPENKVAKKFLNAH